MRKLLRSVKGSRPVDLRARAVLSLLVIYGLRSGEVSRLLLSDFDWREEVFVVTTRKEEALSAIRSSVRLATPSCNTLKEAAHDVHAGTCS